MIIDFHAHIFPDALAAKAVPQLARKGNVPYYLNGTVSDLLASLDAAKIDRAVVLSIATNPRHTPKMIEFLKTLDDPRLIPFGAIHPLDPQYAYYLDTQAELGFKGIKLHPEYQGFKPDDPDVIRVLKYAARKGFILLFHGGADVAFPPPNNGTPERFANMLNALGYDKCVIAHMGGWRMWEEVLGRLAGRDVYFDTSLSLSAMAPQTLRRFFDYHDAEKILFGTDSPWSDQKSELAFARGTALDPAVADAILGGNAARLLGLNTVIK